MGFAALYAILRTLKQKARRLPGFFVGRDSAQPLKPRRSFQRFSSALVSWSKGWKPGR